MQYAIPPLLKSASIDNACFLSDAGELNPHEESEGYETINVDVRSVGEKRITINTALLEEKTLACQMLYHYAMELEEGFMPYVQPTTQVLLPLVRYVYSENVRTSAICTLPTLLLATAKHAKKLGQPPLEQAALWKEIIEPLLESLETENVLDNVHCILEALSEGIATLDADMLTLKQVQMIHLVLVDQLKASALRRKEREEVRESPDFDEQENEALDEENEQEDELLGYAHLVISKLATVLGAQYLPFYKKDLHAHFWPLLESDSTGMVTAGLCVIDDLIAFSGAKEFVETFLPYAIKSDPDTAFYPSPLFLCACVRLRFGALLILSRISSFVPSSETHVTLGFLTLPPRLYSCAQSSLQLRTTFTCRLPAKVCDARGSGCAPERKLWHRSLRRGDHPSPSI